MDEETPEQRKFLRSTSIQYDPESGMDNSRVASVGVSFLLRLVDSMVLDCTWFVAGQYSDLDAGHGMGSKMRKYSG